MGVYRHPYGLKRAQLFGELARKREVVTTRVRLIQHVKVLTREAYTPEAIGTPRTGDALYEVSARSAALAFDAVLAPDQGLTVSAMRAVGAVQATHTVMAPYQALRITAERAIAATLARVAGNTPRTGGTLTHLSHEIAETRLEFSRTELFRRAAHWIHLAS